MPVLLRHWCIDQGMPAIGMSIMQGNDAKWQVAYNDLIIDLRTGV